MCFSYNKQKAFEVIMKFKYTEDISSDIYKDALDLRTAIFIIEQNISVSDEIDSLEDQCTHIVCYIDNQPVGTCRLYFKTDYVKIQRVAVSKQYRKQNIGKQLLDFAQKFAINKGYHTFKLGAQNTAIPFYEKLGFTICSEEYLDANIKHHDMIKEMK